MGTQHAGCALRTVRPEQARKGWYTGRATRTEASKGDAKGQSEV